MTSKLTLEATETGRLEKFPGPGLRRVWMSV